MGNLFCGDFYEPQTGLSIPKIDEEPLYLGMSCSLLMESPVYLLKIFPMQMKYSSRFYVFYSLFYHFLIYLCIFYFYEQWQNKQLSA